MLLEIHFPPFLIFLTQSRKKHNNNNNPPLHQHNNIKNNTHHKIASAHQKILIKYCSSVNLAKFSNSKCSFNATSAHSEQQRRKQQQNNTQKRVWIWTMFQPNANMLNMPQQPTDINTATHTQSPESKYIVFFGLSTVEPSCDDIPTFFRSPFTYFLSFYFSFSALRVGVKIVKLEPIFFSSRYVIRFHNVSNSTARA